MCVCRQMYLMKGGTKDYVKYAESKKDNNWILVLLHTLQFSCAMTAFTPFEAWPESHHSHYRIVILNSLSALTDFALIQLGSI